MGRMGCGGHMMVQSLIVVCGGLGRQACGVTFWARMGIGVGQLRQTGIMCHIPVALASRARALGGCRYDMV